MALNPIVPTDPAKAAGNPAKATQADPKLKATAKKFEAMFLGEMLRLARPKNNAAGAFAAGQAESSWQVFMDQALGQAAAAQDSSGLGHEIEQALQAAQNSSAKKGN